MAGSTSRSTSAGRHGLVWSGQTLTIQDDALFGPSASGLLERFLKRVFHVEEVREVEIDRTSATVWVRCRRGLGAFDRPDATDGDGRSTRRRE